MSYGTPQTTDTKTSSISVCYLDGVDDLLVYVVHGGWLSGAKEEQPRKSPGRV